MLKYFIELEIEEEWFDKKFDSLDLSHQWNLRIEQYLNKTPHSHVEGVLRHSHWTKEESLLENYLGIFLYFVVVYQKNLMTILFQSF